MGQAGFEDNIRAFSDAVAACSEIRPATPMLVLIYSLVDSMAWHCRPDNQPDVVGKDFEDWVARYVLPHPRLPVSPTDLYAARCGLLHSHSPESRKAREGKAARIFYVWGTAKEKDLQFWIHFVAQPAVAIHVDVLREAVFTAIEKLRKEMRTDLSLATRILKRSEKAFGTMPNIPMPPGGRT